MKEDKIFSRQDQKITDGKYNLFFETNGETEEFQEKKETYFYRYDECDGRRENGTASAVYQIKKRGKARRRDRFDSNLFAGKSD